MSSVGVAGVPRRAAQTVSPADPPAERPSGDAPRVARGARRPGRPGGSDGHPPPLRAPRLDDGNRRHIEGNTEQDLMEQAPAHAESAHPDLELDEETVANIRSRSQDA
ncbi:MAG: DUF1059 domain-containing protein [Haloarculaceae archaeon]